MLLWPATSSVNAWVAGRSSFVVRGCIPRLFHNISSSAAMVYGPEARNEGFGKTRVSPQASWRETHHLHFVELYHTTNTVMLTDSMFLTTISSKPT